MRHRLNMTNDRISFDNFFRGTIASFRPAPLPYREPDHISPSGSCYWQGRLGLWRASDHWSGQHGCADIASCIWQISCITPAGEWVSGYAPYKAIRRRAMIKVYAIPTASDRELAKGLLLGREDLLADRSPSPALSFTLGQLHADSRSTKMLKAIAWGTEPICTHSRLENLHDVW